MEDDSFNVTKTSRPLKHGELRILEMPSAIISDVEPSSHKSLYQHRSDLFSQQEIKTVRATSPEFPYSLCFLPPSQQLSLPITPSSTRLNNFVSWRQVTDEFSSIKAFSKAPGTLLPRKDSNPSLLDGSSGASSPESVGHTCRGSADRYQPSLQPHTNAVSTQTERSPYEEKYLIRDMILQGCEQVAKLAQRMPFLTEMRHYAEYIHEKTMQSRAQDICSRITAGNAEHRIVTEYVKTFIKIADSWLDARNCFGLADRCNNACSLDARDLPANYIEWMHSSRQLLNSIVAGLEKINLICDQNKVLASTQNMSAIPTSTKTAELGPQIPAPGGFWGYSQNPPCHCASVAPRVEAPQSMLNVCLPLPTWYADQPAGLYSCPPFNVDNAELNSEYLKPSSYDVPRRNLTASKKRHNISKAKAEVFQDSNISKGYVVALPNTGSKRELGLEAHDQEEARSSKDKIDVSLKHETGANEQKNKAQLLLSQLNQNKMKQYQDDNESNSGDEYAICTRPSSITQSWKGARSTWASAKKRRSLCHPHVAHIQEIFRVLTKYDFPVSVKHPAKETECLQQLLKNPISLENICSKVKNNIYETIDQFIQDCRHFFVGASLNCQNNKYEKENMEKLRVDFETMLEEHFGNNQNWYQTVDAKELIHHPEVKQANVRRIGKSLQCTQD